MKRYVQEAGRAWLEQRIGGHVDCYSSAISYAEVHATFARKQREGHLSQIEFLRIRNGFERDWLEVREVAIDQEVLSPIPELVRHTDLRGMDAIHLAAIIWLHRKFDQELQVFTSDRRLLIAARQYGFSATDPVEAEDKAS